MIVNLENCDPSTGYELCIYPAESRRKRAAWVMWIAPDGSGSLYTKRSESGAVQGEPIELPRNINRRKLVGAAGKRGRNDRKSLSPSN